MQAIFLLTYSCIILQSSIIYAVEDSCDGYLPANSKCTINFEVSNNVQATALCREFLPTTFVIGEKKDVKVYCTATKQFDCTFLPDSIAMFDKCYKFTKEEITMTDYIANPTRHCQDSSIPVFLTHSQAKFVAIEAAKQGMDKIWINADKNGKTVVESAQMSKGFKIIHEPWKINKDHYWDGEELKSNDLASAQYLVFRSQTDYMKNLFAGSFERATESAKAHIICEHEAKFVSNQEPYCDMMQEMSIDAKYDEKTHRCIYKTLSEFVLGHTVEHLKQFRGCDEKPSPDYTAGIDDGMSDTALYKSLTLQDTARIAALKVDMSLYVNGADRNWEGDSRKYCDSRQSLAPKSLNQSRAKFQVYNHQFNPMASKNLKNWKDQYPLNECTDFSRDKEWFLEQESNGLAIKEGNVIDIPTLVPTSVMCSIDDRAECHTRRPCKEGQKCVPSEEWNKDTQGFTKCECIAYHVKDAGTQTCRWQDDRTAKGKICAMIGIKNVQMEKLTVGDHYYLSGVGNNLDDKVNYLVVRDKCTVSLYSHPGYDSVSNNYALIRDAKAGEYDVPNKPEDMFGFEWGFAASSAKCSCQ